MSLIYDRELVKDFFRRFLPEPIPGHALMLIHARRKKYGYQERSHDQDYYIVDSETSFFHHCEKLEFTEDSVLYLSLGLHNWGEDKPVLAHWCQYTGTACCRRGPHRGTIGQCSSRMLVESAQDVHLCPKGQVDGF